MIKNFVAYIVFGGEMKKLSISVVCCFLIGWLSLAAAHGPVRQKVVEKIDIDAAPAVVWAKLKDFGDMSWLPPVKSVAVEDLPASDGKCEENDSNAFVWVGKEGGAGAACANRVLTLNDGGSVSETIKRYSDKKMKYSYRISNMSTVKTIKYSGEDVPIKSLPVTNYSATIMVKDNKKGGSEVTWKSGFYRGYMNNNPPPELTEEVAVEAVTNLFKTGLGNLKTVVESK